MVLYILTDIINNDIIKYLKNEKRDFSILDYNGSLILENFENKYNIINVTLSDIEYDYINNQSSLFSKNWYLNSIKYRNLYIGEHLEYDIYKFMISFYKTQISFSKILNQNSPNEIIAIGNNSPTISLIELICKEKNIYFESLNNFNPKISSKKFQLKKFIKIIYSKCLVFMHNFKVDLKYFSPGFNMYSSNNAIYFNPYINFNDIYITIFGNSHKKIVLPTEYLDNPKLVSNFSKKTASKIFISNKFITNSNNNIIGLQTNSLLDSLQLFLKNKQIFDESLLTLFNIFLKKYTPESILHIDQAFNIIEKYNINATLLPFDHIALSRSLVMVGKLKNVISIMYQHGAINNFKNFPLPISERIIAWDNISKQSYLNLGIPVEKIKSLEFNIFEHIVFNNIKFNNFGNQSKCTKKVLFAAQPYVGLSELDDPIDLYDILNDIFSLSKLFLNTQFFLKLHPEDINSPKYNFIKQYIKSYQNIKLVDNNIDSLTIINNCDIIISETSTCLYESAILGKSSISYNKRRYVKKINPYYKDLRIKIIEDYAALIDYLQKLFNEPNKVINNDIKSFMQNKNYDVYYDDRRWDIFSLIPNNAIQILDIGCGSGWLGKSIKTIKSCQFTGLELNSTAASIASSVYDKVIISNMDNNFPDFGKIKFDCIIFSDILEHLNNPVEILEKARTLLSNNGIIIISLPNISHYTIILQLFKDNFIYTDEGLLDRTHKKFFTLKSIFNVVNNADMNLLFKCKNILAGRLMKFFNFITFHKFYHLITFQNIVILSNKND